MLGGSFDPVHEGHLHVARAARDHLALDEVRFLLTPTSPLKHGRTRTSAAARSELLAAAVAGERGFRVDLRELDRAPPYYTIDTLDALAASLPRGVTLFFLIGSDSLRDLPRWHRARELLERHVLATVPRGDDLEPAFAALEAELPTAAVASLRRHVIPVAPMPISSTDVRERLARGEDARGLVPAAVLARIEALGLYR